MNILNTKSIFMVGILLITTLLFSQNTLAESYAIIINNDNPYVAKNTDSAKRDIQLFFLKNMHRWPHSEKVRPYSLISTNKGQLAFNKSILKMSAADLTQHWLNKKQTSGETPPKALKSDRAVITLVSNRVGAFGIVSMDTETALPDTVKVLFTF